MTRRHGKDNERTTVEDRSETPAANETEEPAGLQAAAPALPSDNGQDAAAEVAAGSNATGDVPNIARVVEGPSAEVEVDDLASMTGPGSQTTSVEGLATTRSRKARAPRRKNVSAGIGSTPSTAAVVSNEFQDLDDEIQQLRSQLAKKLQRQNAQLRQMLERFER
ncbi:hypothetical protein [Rhizobium sp. YTU87027]|uniref:hypothetical protein n=1 Tax=Rhizobium sp. YTU87027 TaxID=3417741 RepID=UPI003D68235B